MDLQQYLSNPNSSKTFFWFSPSEILCLKSSHKWPIGFPQLKQRTGIIILFFSYKFIANWNYHNNKSGNRFLKLLIRKI